MTSDHVGRDLAVGVTPFTEPNADLVVAAERAGGLGVLDLGREERATRRELARVRPRWGGSFGVRIPAGCPLSPGDLADDVDTLLLDPVASPGPWPAAGRRILAEVTSLAEAREALRHGAHGLIARGAEAGGRIGELSTFILLQQLLAELDVPIWAAGGMRHSWPN
ncbi:MAG TPA: nitronate monooxygenase [Trebonia sp.]|jgi:NAD(P)H-dependent flavin oxidoreductase YrpB (nitropropane dioxygenase family)